MMLAAVATLVQAASLHPSAGALTTDAASAVPDPTVCILDYFPPHGFNPRGQPFPAADPHTLPQTQDCKLAGESRRIAFVHIGKTSGSSINALLSTNRINYTQYEVTMGAQLGRELNNYDFFIIPTRDPLARSVSAFNFDHLVGGSSEMMMVHDWGVTDFPVNCTGMGCAFCVPEDRFSTKPASNFEMRPGKGILAPYLEPNMTLAPLVMPCDYDSYPGMVPAAPKPLMASMYTECFPQLPGGVSAWAEALDGEGACADLARRHLHETAESTHLNNGFDAYVRGSGLLDKLRAELTTTTPRGARRTELLVVRLENIDDDIAHMFDRLCVANPQLPTCAGVSTDFPRHDDTTLSAAGEASLRAHLHGEYHALNSILALATLPMVNGTSPGGQTRFY